ncbi:MAG TPA: PaaI family thioesterase [Syntrophales bacterium]|mgnify:FL=1|nr:PaaI family thioesterase [Syntrophales bacterium]
MADYTEKPKNWRDLPPEELAAFMNRKSEGYLPALLGFTLTSVAKERVVARMAVRKHHLAPNDYLHAASVVALADTVCGMATIVNLPKEAGGFTTIELKTNFLGTTRDGAILCEGRPAHIGRRTMVWDARVWDEKTGHDIALFRCTQMILPGKA